MDKSEHDLREREIDQNRRLANRSTVVSGLSVLVATAAIVWSVLSTSANGRESTRQATYHDLISGLGSTSAAVQTGSMRTLVEYVRDEGNYAGDSAKQQRGAEDAMAILRSFIEDESIPVGRGGLADYQSPQPLVVPEALRSIKAIAENRAFRPIAVDVSRGNFHGVSFANFSPLGGFLAVGADFRRANLSHLDLEKHGADLRYAFFTCANLSDAKLGATSMMGTDLTGADLSGADLSNVTGLTTQQLHGATASKDTKLPKGVRISGNQWGSTSSSCSTLVNHMTAMRAGQGFGGWHCPTTRLAAKAYRDGINPAEHVHDLIAVCRARLG